MSDTTPVIQTRHLTKIFKDFWGRPRVKAVDDISFDVVQGEVFGLLGPNGSGKSTTLKLALGLLFPTHGNITVLNQPAVSTQIKNRIGFLPEESYLYRYLNASETLSFYGKLFNLDARTCSTRTKQLLDMVGLGNVGRRPVREFSKGMMRRLGIAQALINDPDVIFLDEPTSGLDPIGTRQVKDLIVELKSRGKTVFLCSHLLADVEDVCDRIAILYGGKIKAHGRVSELLEHNEAIQIRLEKPADKTVQGITELLEQFDPACPVKVERPKDRLEQFFMRVIQRAVEARDATSGAQVATPQPAEPVQEREEYKQIKTDVIKKLLNASKE